MPEASPGTVRVVRLAMAGYGTVGRAMHRIVSERHDAILERHGIDLRLVGIARRDRYAVQADGLPLETTPAWKPGNVFEMMGEAQADIFLEATPTDLVTAQPALGHVRGAFREGMAVVMANKGPLVVACNEVMERAAEAGRPVRFEATVAGCIPVMATADHALSGDRIRSIQGILNGTTNFMLTRMAEEGSDLDQALREAQSLGYAEADPSADLDGLDAAAKIVILANTVLGLELGMDDVDVQGIRDVSRQAVELASSHGHRIRLVGEVDEHGNARVGPRLVPRGSPLDVRGALNAVTYATALAGDVTLVGNGAGGMETAAAMLSDVLQIARSQGVRGA